MKETYFVINNSDGDTTVTELTKEQLLKAIQEHYWGDKEIFAELPKNNDTNYWGENILIIKGKVVTPVPEQVVTKYNIE
jgi:hypothetical protein